MSKEVPQVNNEFEARSNVANAWLIDADYALTNPMEQKIEDETLEAIATRAKMGEPIILFSTKDETWLTHHIASRLGPLMNDRESLSKIVLQGRNSQESFELRFTDENNSEQPEYLGFGEHIQWNPSQTLDFIESQDMLPASFNIISTKSANLKLDTKNLTAPKTRMIHVGLDEDREYGLEDPGFFDAGVRASLLDDLKPAPFPSLNSPTYEEDFAKWKEENGK